MKICFTILYHLVSLQKQEQNWQSDLKESIDFKG